MFFLNSATLKGLALVGFFLLTLGSWFQLDLLPGPRSIDSTPTEFSALRAFEHVKVLSQAPRSPLSQAHNDAKAYLVQVLGNLGCKLTLQKTFSVTQWRQGIFANPTENIICVFPGLKPEALLLVSHYDSVPLSPGASDAGAGVAIILESVRALLHRPRDNTLVVLFTDGEETGLHGSSAFLESEMDQRLNVKALINFEARGSSGPVALFETQGFNSVL